MAFLINLTSLNLSNNSNIAGDKALQFVSCLTNMRVLRLSKTKVNDNSMKYLKGLHQLQVLKLANTDISSEGMLHIRTLTELRSMNLGQNRICDKGVAGSLVHLVNLTELNISQNRITTEGINKLQGLSQLTHLDLTGYTSISFINRCFCRPSPSGCAIWWS